MRSTLLQVRNENDPMRSQEVACFARVLDTSSSEIAVVDLLTETVSNRVLNGTDLFLLGGSGDYSVTGEGDWLERAFDLLRRLHEIHKPTFASCWGFQAMSRALGGRVVHDLERAEIGTHHLYLTDAGRADPMFSPLGETFSGQMGHEDYVADLPPGAILLASTRLVRNQAYRIDGVPIYCTQFHPELNCQDLLERVQAYPKYIQRIAGLPPERFSEMIRETPETELLLRRFISLVFAS